MVKDINYRQLSLELEKLIDQLQNGDLNIDVAIKKYEYGMKLIDQLQTYLKEAENKVSKIKKTFEK